MSNPHVRLSKILEGMHSATLALAHQNIPNLGDGIGAVAALIFGDGGRQIVFGFRVNLRHMQFIYKMLHLIIKMKYINAMIGLLDLCRRTLVRQGSPER